MTQSKKNAKESFIHLLNSLKGTDLTQVMNELEDYKLSYSEEDQQKIIKFLIFLFNRNPALNDSPYQANNFQRVENYIKSLPLPPEVEATLKKTRGFQKKS